MKNQRCSRHCTGHGSSQQARHQGKQSKLAHSILREPQAIPETEVIEFSITFYTSLEKKVFSRTRKLFKRRIKSQGKVEKDLKGFVLECWGKKKEASETRAPETGKDGLSASPLIPNSTSTSTHILGSSEKQPKVISFYQTQEYYRVQPDSPLLNTN